MQFSINSDRLSESFPTRKFCGESGVVENKNEEKKKLTLESEAMATKARGRAMGTASYYSEGSKKMQQTFSASSQAKNSALPAVCLISVAISVCNFSDSCSSYT